MNYVRRPYQVIAFQHDGSETSAQQLAAWVQGKNESSWFLQPLGEADYQVHVVTDVGSQVVKANDWLVYNETGIANFVAYTAEQFASSFDAVEEPA